MKAKEFQSMVSLAIKKTLAQGKKSLNARGCVYRGDGGLCCPVGFMLTDAEAKKADALRGVSESVQGLIEAGIWGVNLKSSQVNVLLTVQRAHDRARDYDFVKDFEAGLIGVSYEA